MKPLFHVPSATSIRRFLVGSRLKEKRKRQPFLSKQSTVDIREGGYCLRSGFGETERCADDCVNRFSLTTYPTGAERYV